MKSRGKTLTAILAGGVLLASTAYGIGTQVGGGGATAADDSSSRDERREMRMRMDRGERFGRAALARRLGVSEERLRTALEEIRGEMEPPGDRRERMVADLAEALGVSADKLRAALEQLRPRIERRHRGGPRRFAAALANELGIEVADVRAALRKLRSRQRAEHEARREAFARALAEELDIPVARVRAALPKRGPGHRGCGGRMHPRFGWPSRPGGPPGMARPGSFAPDGPPPGPEGAGLKF